MKYTNSKKYHVNNDFKVKKIILITIDALRNDAKGVNILYKNIEKYFESIVFTKAYSNGPGTNQSFPSIMASTPFLAHDGLKPNEGIPLIAEILSRAGYHTVAFHSNPFLSRRFRWNRGYREFYDFLGERSSPAEFVVSSSGLRRKLINLTGMIFKGSNKHIWSIANKIYYRFKGFNLPYLDAQELNAYLIKWMKNKDKNFKQMFLWIHYMDTHFPYAPPDNYLQNTEFSSRREIFFYNYKLDFENPDPKIINKLRKIYEISSEYVADNVKSLLESFSKYDFLDNSLIIVTADHGEAFLEHGKYGHAYDMLYNEILRVPLIIGISNNSLNKHLYGKPVQLMDIPPTILDLAGIKKPPIFKGRSLIRLIKGDLNKTDIYPIFSESAVPDLIHLKYDTSKYIVSVILDEWKLIMDKICSQKPKYELYNLTRDPEENQNDFGKNDIAKNLTSLIKYHMNEINHLKKFGNNIKKIRLKIKKYL